MKKPVVNRKDAAAVSFASEKFKELYGKKWKSKKLSQKEFARRVNEAMWEQGEDGDCNFRYVSSWLSGDKFPQKYFRAVCAVLEVDESEFIPAGYENQYRYSTKYQDEVGKWQDDVAQKNFELNLSLIKALKELTNFDSEFPVYAPLGCVSAKPEEGYPFNLKYERMMPLKAAEADANRNLFQIRKGDTTINLSPSDMKFLKLVQDVIIRNVRTLFEYHRQELAFSEVTAAARCKSVLTVDLDEGPLTPEELQEIDPYGFYTEKERKRQGQYGIPPEPEGLPYTSVYRQGLREQIQFKPDTKPISEWLQMLQTNRGEDSADYDPGKTGDDNNMKEKDGETT